MATEKSTPTRTAKRTDSSSATPKKRPAPRPKKPSAAELAQGAAGQLADLTGRQVEGVTRFERTDDGWTVEIDVLELSRVPNTTDVLATYEVDMSSDGELVGYRRVHRYVRGVAGEE